MKEFHAATNVKSTVTMKREKHCGSMISNMMRRCPAPSSLADSTVSSGTERNAIAPMIMYMPIVHSVRMTAKRVCVSPSISTT